MNRIVMIVTAAALLCNGIFSTRTRADEDTATVQATSNLNGSFPEPNPRDADSGVLPGSSIALAKDDIAFTDPDTHFTVSGHQRASVTMAKIQMYEIFTAQGDRSVGMAGILTGKFHDQITVSPTGSTENWDEGVLALSATVNGTITGEGRYGGTLFLDIVIHNAGSLKKPKDLTYKIHWLKSWGTSGDNYTQSGPLTIKVNNSDVMTLDATETLMDNVNGNDGSSSINADFSHTTLFYMDSQTPGLTLATASGHDYATPPQAAANKTWALYE